MNEQQLISRLAAPGHQRSVRVDLDAVIATARLRRRRRWEVAGAMAATGAVIAGLVLTVGSLEDTGDTPAVAARGGNVGSGAPSEWTLRPPGIHNKRPSAIAAISDSDVWTVGYRRVNDSSTKAAHWDGQRWQQFDLPPLTGVSGVASDDVWAVGTVGTAQDPKPIAMHWDGRAWQSASVPRDRMGGRLWKVAAVAADDAWAIGGVDPADPQAAHPYIVRWDGNEWRTAPTPAVPGAKNMILHDIYARTADDVWVVGVSDAAPGSSPLALHWDGRQWSVLPVTTEVGELRDVVALAPDDVWAITADKFFHWDGNRWQDFLPPEPDYSNLYTLAPDGTGGVLAAGRWGCIRRCDDDDRSEPGKALVTRWTGSAWTRIDGPPTGPGGGSLHDLSTTPDTGTVWAMGSTADGVATSVNGTLVSGPAGGPTEIPLVAAASFRE
ncbi:MAG TPA: hypothetical protein VFV67_05980 [Actinophytocola sp.]|uniref:hypothetical protein n=1 Tax=Actinophytocola sp. TaxID=1872138 RepID=UPI002DBEC65D|nr:hypothetical protein [Actinophytocola sp.]HEU5470183.1 hypothetical protein [Actinophytocola sp.]